jgi:hypothetical protein
MATVKKTVKKAQQGISRASYTTYDPKKKLYTQLDRFKHSDGDRYYRSTSGDQQIVGDMNMMGSYGNAPDSVRAATLSPAEKKAMERKKNGGKVIKSAKTPAWTRSEGKSKSGGLNAKGRASYNRANPGSNLKAPQPQGGPRKRSFCARMSGVKGPATKPNGEPTRKTLALRKWKC